jgi:hypothetical protein
VSLEYQFKPIEQWPGKETHPSLRKRARFNSSYSQTLKDLERELKHLSARQIILQADVRPEDVRLDGMLRANASPRSPKIILSFQSKHGPLSYPCDRFMHWEDNLRAIALSLEALRSVDRYGVTRSAEQYKGWAKLSAPDAAMSWEAACRCLAKYREGMSWGHVQHLSDEEFVLLCRKARATSHPDRNNGNSAEFLEVQKAIEVLSEARE